jgi:hypothetical protein
MKMQYSNSDDNDSINLLHLLAVKNCKCSEGNPRPGFEPGAPRDVVSIDPSIRGVFQYTSWLEVSF